MIKLAAMTLDEGIYRVSLSLNLFDRDVKGASAPLTRHRRFSGS